MSTQNQISPPTLFGTTADGHPVQAYTLTSTTGPSATIITYGGTITRLLMPDRNGALGDVTLGFDNLKQYETESPYFGALVGRVCNRIAKGAFSLNGKTYKLAINNGPNSLHGGLKGYDKRIWSAEPRMTPEGPSLTLTLTDPDGTEGYPATVNVTVVYTLVQNTLRIDYTAKTDKPTPINLTNHAYFNLRDGGKSDILSHILELNADHYTPVDETLIPTGHISPVKNTPIDFTTPKPIGKDLLAMGGTPVGYDHNVVLNSQDRSLNRAATVIEPITGRQLDVYTTEPGMQFYTGNFLNGATTGRDGAIYKQYHAFCLETQHFPDSIHHPPFPTTILEPHQTYRHITEFRFSIAPEFR
jgi:aldose 1-epimerase